MTVACQAKLYLIFCVYYAWITVEKILSQAEPVNPFNIDKANLFLQHISVARQSKAVQEKKRLKRFIKIRQRKVFN